MHKWISLVLFFGLSALTGTVQSQPPNVIVFIADDVSWDDLGCYGNKDVKTPHIDRLAKNGLIFNNFFLTASSCSPSRNSIMTGRYPHNTGAAELHTQPPPDMISFPEKLKSAGYYTAQAGKFHMGEYAMRGFSRTYLEGNGAGGEDNWIKALSDRQPDRPFFMWFAALDAHRPWAENDFAGSHPPDKLSPPPYLADGPLTRRDLADYYDEITRFDHFVGEVMKYLQDEALADNTLIVVMADNGRPFPHSKTRLNDSGIKSPFIAYWPRQINPGGRCDALVSAIDLGPTILDLAGQRDLPPSFQGRSFAHLFTRPNDAFRNVVFAEHNWHDYEAHERMVRTSRFLYVRNARPQQPNSGPADAVGSDAYQELLRLYKDGKLTAMQAAIFQVPQPEEALFDLQQDPLQFVNVASLPAYERTRDRMRALLRKWTDETGDDVPAQLTRDWYLREPGYKQTPFINVRGEMPGTQSNAVSNNSKGPF